MYLLLLCQMSNSMSRGNALEQNRRNSLPCTDRTSRQRSYNQRVDCLKWLGSKAHVWPSVFINFPWGMNRKAVFGLYSSKYTFIEIFVRVVKIPKVQIMHYLQKLNFIKTKLKHFSLWNDISKMASYIHTHSQLK